MADNVIELVLKVVDEAVQPLKQVEVAFDSLSRSITGLSLGALGGIGAVVAGVKVMIDETSQMQDATVRLDRTYKAFAETLNVSRGSLTRFAETAQQSTRFSAAAVTEAQQTLIKFGSLTGTQLMEAQTVMLDLAEQMGGNLSSAAMVLSRALTNPLQSARLLRQAGVELTDQEKEQIKSWEDLDQHGQSVALILDKLKERTSGAAQSALDTYSGAWDHLKNTWKEIANNPEVIKLLTGAMNSTANRVGDNWFSSDTEQHMERVKQHLIDLYAAAKKAGDTDPSGTRQTQIKGLEDELRLLQAQLWVKQQQEYADTRATRAAEANALEEIVIFGNAKKAQEEYDKEQEQHQRDLEDHIKTIAEAMALTTIGVAKEQEAMHAFDAAVELTIHEGARSLAEGQQIIWEHTNEVLNEVVVTANYATKKLKEPLDAASLQHIEMVKNIQNAFADMFNHIDGGIRGMLSAFLNALKQMVIQAEAAHLTEAIFGKIDSKTGAVSGGSSWGTAIASIFGKILGFAEGGTVPGGSPVLVGEHGPELAFFPGGTQIMNQNQLATAGGGVHYAPVTTFLMQPKDGDAQSLRTEFYAAMQRNNQRMRDDIYYTLNRNGFGRIR